MSTIDSTVFCRTYARVSMEVRNSLVSWFITYVPDLQPTYIGVTIHLLSIMDNVVGIYFINNSMVDFHLNGLYLTCRVLHSK